MKNRYSLIPLFCLLTAILTGPAHSQQTIRCTFRMTSPSLQHSSKVCITGNLQQLGFWDPGKVVMEQTGDHTWSTTVTLGGPDTIEYKYTLGRWEWEGADASLKPLGNYRVCISSDTVLHDTVLAWTDRPLEKRRQNTITGTSHTYPGFKGKGLLDRDVVVWIPPGYASDTTRRYPVIYLHDGQNIFDEATSAFGTEWGVDEAIDSLSRAGEIPPVIAVAICNTPDRSVEYLPGDTAQIYMDFIVGELKPFIDSMYRTLPGPEHTLTCGASAGGAIAFMLVWEHPDVFSKGICMSPALKVLKYDYVGTVAATGERRENIFLYMDVGGIGVDTLLQPGMKEMADLLERKGYRRGTDFVVVVEPSASHDEAAWGRRFPGALLHCFGHAEMTSSAVFISGEEGYSHFRIPALAAGDGLLFAFVEGRRQSVADHGEISIVLKRSADGGHSWSPLTEVVKASGGSAQNPTPVWIEETETLLLLYTRRTVGTDTEYMIRNGTSEGYMGVYMKKSLDRGLTWSPEKEITRKVKKKNWRWYALGPGGAIVMKYNAAHAGRIIVPANHSLSGGAGNEFLGAHVIYSDDHGMTWSIGAVDSEGEGSVNPNETAVAELKNGDLYFNTRNHSMEDTVAHRAFTVSHDGGKSFAHPFRHEPALLTPIVHAAMTRDDHKVWFIAPNDWNERVNLTLWQSDDETKSWSRKELIHEGAAAYSSSCMLGDDRLAILFEADDYGRILFRAWDVNDCPQ